MRLARAPRRAAGLSEYLILVTLVAMAMTLAIVLFSTELIHKTGTVATGQVDELQIEAR